MTDRCALCDTASYEVLWHKDGFRYVRCCNCGLVYVLPRQTADEIQEIYDDGFETKSAKHPLPVDFRSYDPILKALEPYRKNKCLLDIGCFKGHFMLAAKERGWEVYGTEICQQAALFTRSAYGLEVFCGAIHDAEYDEDQFDAVTLLDVLEHLLNPLTYLKEIHRVLRPGGVVYADVPNFNAIMRYVLKERWSVFFPWHFTYFTAATLREMLSRAGFTARIVSTGLGPMSTFNPYLSLQKDSSITNSRPRLRDSSFVQRHKKPLKTAWLIGKAMGNVSFRLLSHTGVFAGSKLVVIATK